MSDELKPRGERRYHYRSIYFPLLLLAIGIVLLLNSLNFIQGDTWEVLIRLWPILLIIGGLDSLFQRHSYVSSVFSIGVGALFLLYYFNYLRLWDIHLWDILRLWPFLLLGWGLDIIVGRRTAWSFIVGLVVGLALTAAMFWLLLNPLSIGSAANIVPVEQSVGEAETAELDLSMSSGKLVLSGETEPSQLVSGEASLHSGEEIYSNYSMQGKKGIFRIGGEDITGYINSSNTPGLDLDVNAIIPLTIYTEVNFGEQDIDLRGLQVDRFNLSQSVGQVVLTLPSDVLYHGSVTIPVGDLTIEVPAGSKVRIALDKGITVLSYPSGYIRQGDIITSPGTGSEGEVPTLQVSVPVGMIRVVEVP